MKRIILTLLSVILIAAGVALQLTGSHPAQASAVTIQVSTTEKIVLSMGDPTVDFGILQPGSTTTSATAVELTVSSNVPWDLSYAASGLDAVRGLPLSSLKWGLQTNGSDATPMGQSGAFVMNEPKNAAYTATHYYTLDMPWTASPGAYAASITYTAVAHL